MAPPKISKERFDAAVKSMADIGVSRETVSPVLKNLLELFDYNWEHIEADSFRALADAIFDNPIPREGQKRQANKTKNLNLDHCNKKLKIKEQCQKPTSKIHANDKRELAEAVLEGEVTGNQLQLPSARLLIKEPNMQINAVEDTTIGENSSALLLRGQGLQTFETPIAVICPQVLDSSPHSGHEDAHRTSGVEHAADQKYKGVSVGHERNMTDACSNQAIVISEGLSTNFEVALSHFGIGKLSFTYNSSLANHSDFRMPDMESICKEMEARCLRTYKILEPNFSFMKLLEDTCQCIVDLGFESSGPREKGVLQIVPAVDYLSKPSVPQILLSNQAGSSCMPPNNLMRLGGIRSSSAIAGVSQNNMQVIQHQLTIGAKRPPHDVNDMSLGGIRSSSAIAGVSQNNMQVIQHQLTIGAKRPPHDVNDITKGEELVSIPIVNGASNGILPPPFHYIPRNITFQNAYINLSLARIGDANCCSDCFGDCLAQPLPCACATETGGEFAYTRDGLLKEGFLDSCVSMLREPLKHPHFYCKICPHERVKIEVNSDLPNTEVNPDPCKGHLLRKFIKECWSKCGCARNCVNRVVQRGITRHLQVFLAPGNKGWGLRTAEKLPRGAFVCEYVGEILTNIELYERTIQKTGNAKHTYPLLLDADWGTEGFLKDEEALCLDGTFYGNVARFINHRCFDANIIGIPVEIETPDHHYYHLAFFTTRQIEPFEELTWDYGIDFDDVNHPVKAFKCRCGSELCRDKRRISRSKSRALVLL